MSESLRSVLIGTSALDVILAVALVLTLGRPFRREDSAALERVLHLLLLGVAVQCLHFVEEFLTEFHLRLPQLLGLAPWTPEFFVTFNVFWIAIWVISAAALRAGVRAALFPIWFLAIAMVGNGIAHPALALRTRGYFPGLVTSPVAGIVGVMLWSRLLVLTRHHEPSAAITR